VAPERLLQRRDIQRVRQRKAEPHQPLELFGSCPRLRRFGGVERRLRLHLLPLLVLVKDEHAAKNGERRHQIDVVPQLHIARRVPDKPQRLLEHDDRSRNEPDDERCVVSTDQTHAPAA
jgi:hypothetical protein